jgi:hypothetical protein
VDGERLALSVSSSKWQHRGIREAPLVSAVVRWAMPQACPKQAPPLLERQLRPKAYERLRGGYLDRRRTLAADV